MVDRFINKVINFFFGCSRVDESHPLASLMEVVEVSIENYENRYLPELFDNHQRIMGLPWC